ncbi:MAG: hypothetical protein Q7R66_13175 [Undibacterium sp.]|uniref:hypothetical protein n=1 Tax=Undibacterium sp. TaxID=1914977 RepID=UPI0027263387|nr:hypothetical protein [Undibacterium sp.]MDO8653130.1 hypothetical protein [Undibacterium sp.]
MKNFLISFLLIFSNGVFADTLCQHGDRFSLAETWKSFRHSSLHEVPENISKFYLFPIKLYSPTDAHGRDEKPIILTKRVFLKNYESIFKKNIFNEEVGLFKELKKSTSDDYNTPAGFDLIGCSYQGVANIEDYQFFWSKKNGWLIESVSYIGYGDLVDRFKSNDMIK